MLELKIEMYWMAMRFSVAPAVNRFRFWSACTRAARFGCAKKIIGQEPISDSPGERFFKVAILDGDFSAETSSSQNLTRRLKQEKLQSLQSTSKVP